MKRNFWPALLIGCLAGLALLLAVSNTSAQSGGGYDLTWSTIDNGGAMFSSGGVYQLSGSIGQPDAGTLSGAYTLAGGFWGGGYPYAIYLPVILRN